MTSDVGYTRGLPNLFFLVPDCGLSTINFEFWGENELVLWSVSVLKKIDP